MTITGDHLRAACEVIGTAPTLRDAAALWRAQHPEVRAVLADAADMRDEVPALTLGARRVYLAAASGHCWHVTDRAEGASALILTQEHAGARS